MRRSPLFAINAFRLARSSRIPSSDTSYHPSFQKTTRKERSSRCFCSSARKREKKGHSLLHHIHLSLQQHPPDALALTTATLSSTSTSSSSIAHSYRHTPHPSNLGFMTRSSLPAPLFVERKKRKAHADQRRTNVPQGVPTGHFHSLTITHFHFLVHKKKEKETK